MKRKKAAEPEIEIAVEPEAVPEAAVEPGRTARCVVCGGEGAPNSSEQLCWVCRRLKISAWGDSDSQLAAQE